MQCYNDNDIFIFGFSRGAYVARFLAEMLDHVGLLSAGNEEMARFAWKAFSQWQEREDNTEEEKKKKNEMLEFLQAFRGTFSRPVRRIRFLGLFDTGEPPRLLLICLMIDHDVVNSVPRFENAWMKRKKFPYTARSTAKVIRHAVSIDERRAKFRQDLISESKSSQPRKKALESQRGRETGVKDNRTARREKPYPGNQDRFRRKSRIRGPAAEDKFARQQSGVHEDFLDPRRNTQPRINTTSPGGITTSDGDASSIASGVTSVASFQPRNHPDDDDEEDEAQSQDIEELWFPGCHADLGGGWPLANGEESPLSHAPLVWMVREAQRAGLDFDEESMLKFNCCDENYRIPSDGLDDQSQPALDMPEIQITSSPTQEKPDLFRSPKSEKAESGWAAGLEPEKPGQSDFHRRLLASSTKGVLHDCLQFNNGLTIGSVLSWKMMEYLPFRRMDLRPDGSWKAITFPLPMGETRDIPENAWIHHSAIRRMEANEEYRPGNLIIGGGGRGIRKAPKELGMGKWLVYKAAGDAVGMTYVRKGPSLENQKDKEEFGKSEKRAANGHGSD